MDTSQRHLNFQNWTDLDTDAEEVSSQTKSLHAHHSLHLNLQDGLVLDLDTEEVPTQTESLDGRQSAPSKCAGLGPK